MLPIERVREPGDDTPCSSHSRRRRGQRWRRRVRVGRLGLRPVADPGAAGRRRARGCGARGAAQPDPENASSPALSAAGRKGESRASAQRESCGWPPSGSEPKRRTWPSGSSTWNSSAHGWFCSPRRIEAPVCWYSRWRAAASSTPTHTQVPGFPWPPRQR